MTPEFAPREGSRLGRLAGRTRTHGVLAVVAALVVLVLLVWLYRHHSASVAAQARAAAANRAVPVRVASATLGTVDVTVDALGTVAALNTATIRTRVDGPLLSVPFHEGQLVKAGDLLAQIDPSTFQAALTQAEGQLAKDEAQLAGARVDLERYTGLLAKDSIATQTVDAQRYMVRQLEGTVRADSAAVATARLQLTFTHVTAPFAGRVGLRQVDPGNMVHASDTNGLVVLTQTQPIYVLFAVPSEHLNRIYPHWNRGDVLPVDALDRDNKPLAHGHLAAIDNEIDPATGTIKLKAIFDNEDNALFPAQFVTARLRTDTLTGVTLIPNAAVQRGAPGTFVYVVGAGNAVALRPVTVGPVSGEQIAISAGVKAGERVVIDGLDKLHDGAKVAVITPGTENPVAARAPRARRGGGAPRS
ncbi:MAG: MdtA/MuxA family multidrug efflux RND transporter periplasmic adaptor subunit [Gammaproteobacteria bacterium]|nr:MdtA/MuxA family multidrug efflux RND transporter periplasmic adaptor subunit [Gammaproteobacteria bacterium]MBV9621858.1 MdtA/MuxA family multidrug efflux RND transporter periplasmic adaptor subunit [Gammaproteobacteria bacterium]